MLEKETFMQKVKMNERKKKIAKYVRGIIFFPGFCIKVAFFIFLVVQCWNLLTAIFYSVSQTLIVFPDNSNYPSDSKDLPLLSFYHLCTLLLCSCNFFHT